MPCSCTKLKAILETRSKSVSSPFSLTILGAGGALPVPGRFPSAQYLQINQQGFLIDAGEGVQMQLLQLGISHHRIRHIFISHLHGDHYLGLMGLLFSMHLSARKQELHIYSHSGLDEIILLHLRHAKSVLGFPIHFHHLSPGTHECILDHDELTVSTIPLNHRIACSGFLFKEKSGPYRINKEVLPEEMLLQHIVQLKSGKDVVNENGEILFDVATYTLPPHKCRSYAYCSDTAPHDQLADIIKNCDLVYHEATFLTADSQRAKETFHSTAEQAATLAKQATINRLLIGHISARYKDAEKLLEEARVVFPNTFLAEEGKSYTVGG